jgi:hypothetical protein
LLTISLRIVTPLVLVFLFFTFDDRHGTHPLTSAGRAVDARRDKGSIRRRHVASTFRQLIGR